MTKSIQFVSWNKFGTIAGKISREMKIGQGWGRTSLAIRISAAKKTFIDRFKKFGGNGNVRLCVEHY